MRSQAEPGNESAGDAHPTRLTQAEPADSAFPGRAWERDGQEVGRRLAAWALVKVYGQPGVAMGSIYRSCRRDGNAIVVQFDYLGDGLKTKDGGPVKGFAIAGPDKKFVWAKAKIVGNDCVRVWSEQVAEPAAVRHAWANNPICNLYNSADLPASPFRTDDWPEPVRER